MNYGKWIAGGLALFLVGRALIEIVRIANTSKEDPGLAISMSVNTVLILGAFALVVWLSESNVGADARKRRPHLEEVSEGDAVFEIWKDKQIILAFHRLFPALPTGFDRNGFLGRAGLVSVAVSSQGLSFWTGSVALENFGHIPWDAVRDVEVREHAGITRSWQVLDVSFDPDHFPIASLSGAKLYWLRRGKFFPMRDAEGRQVADEINKRRFTRA
ncbi:hypothetical protein M2152_002198 [Microbacteriaceae bacterium SG_E_30_P1]|uniref:PH (Pleckstrin Homology) domain-containing protein n=1 Tax=Antiquaquibacter oligotrophicus TaxID=2880260 RepID=A0ABT6KPV1_9MICO|nr:hypothetical protein [Antiquaquibacter oligotrophicus]MDH6182016.1 hypothetical protein [Antiquaquibacter oligotrophicus]UDF12316.1 hypothetical protein LH407_09080 [Antiquaquibacter oligotrophicus]